MESSRRTPSCRLRIILRGVRGLSLDEVCVGSTTSGLALADISERQWEDPRWGLHDYEEKMIHCYANEAEIFLER